MATRTIPNPRDRLVAIMIAPLMTCSARRPMYALLISAFIPTRTMGGIFALTVLLWFLASFPAPPAGAAGAQIEYNIAGTLGRWLAVVFEPIGVNWQISIALVPGMAAREVAVSSSGTVYALSATGDDTAHALLPLIAHSWSLATALSLPAWYVFAPQCLSTLATVKREIGGWKWPPERRAVAAAVAAMAPAATSKRSERMPA